MMDVKWQIWIALVCALVLGFALGWIADVPDKVTFDVTPELSDKIDDFTEIASRQVDYAGETCPIRLQECELLCK